MVLCLQSVVTFVMTFRAFTVYLLMVPYATHSYSADIFSSIIILLQPCICFYTHAQHRAKHLWKLGIIGIYKQLTVIKSPQGFV